jgi:hypothetical protein
LVLLLLTRFDFCQLATAFESVLLLKDYVEPLVRHAFRVLH